MSGLEVIGGISAIISIIDASIRTYNGARKDLKLSKTFEAVGHRLPLILDTLQTCKNHLEPTKGSLPANVCEALEKTLDGCKQQARKLREIFEEVIPSEDDAWERRYMKVFKRLGKGNKAEELMISITEDVQLVVNNHAVKSATPEQMTKLDDIIKEMKSVESSVSEDERTDSTFNSGGGPLNVNYSGQQINNNAAVTTQHIHSVIVKQKEDFSFREPAGVCLGRAPSIGSELFIGRKSELEQMKKILQPGGYSRERRRLVIGGMGGIGKTQLAIVYANRHPDDYSSVFWLNAATEATVKQSFRLMAQEIFDVQELAVLDDEQILIQTHRWLSDQRNKQWLLIFDNYDVPSLYKITKYYPSASHGSIIITTRLPDMIQGPSVKVQHFDRLEDSLQVLKTRSGRQNVESDSGARGLAERLHGLPLALATAGAFLKHNSLSFKEYRDAYEKQWNITPKRCTNLPEYERTLYTTWDISLSHLKKEDPETAQLLTLLAYFDNQNIWYELLLAGISSVPPEWLVSLTANAVTFASIMGKLVEHCFVESHSGTNSYSMHTCVHDWTLHGLNQEVDVDKFWFAFDCVASSIATEEQDFFSAPKYQSLAAHATRFVHEHFQKAMNSDNAFDQRIVGAWNIAHLLLEQVQYDAAEKMFRRVLHTEENVLGREHPATLGTVYNLGSLYVRQGRLSEAEEMAQRVLRGRAKSLGPEHTSTLDTVDMLGTLYTEQGWLCKAEEMFRRALQGKEKALGPEHPSTLATVYNLSSLYRHQEVKEAEEMCLRALQGMEKALGPEHPSTLNAVNNLGLLYKHQGKLRKAEEMYQRALRGYEKKLRPDHISTLTTVDNLGILYMEQGRLIEAEQMLQRALQGWEKALGPEHTSTLDTVDSLGGLYLSQRRLSKAEEMYQRALQGWEKALGPEHTSTLNTINNLGILYMDQGKLQEAEEMLRRALQGKEKVLAREHTFTLNTAVNLGNLYKNQGRLEEAEKMYERALQGYEKKLGPEHTSTLTAVNGLGDLYRIQGKLEEAEKMCERSLQGLEKTLGPQHPSTLDSTLNLGITYRCQGKLEEAEKMFRRTLQGYEEVQGREQVRTHPSARKAALNLGVLYETMGRTSEAVEMYLQGLSGLEVGLHGMRGN